MSIRRSLELMVAGAFIGAAGSVGLIHELSLNQPSRVVRVADTAITKPVSAAPVLNTSNPSTQAPTTNINLAPTTPDTTASNNHATLETFTPNTNTYVNSLNNQTYYLDSFSNPFVPANDWTVSYTATCKANGTGTFTVYAMNDPSNTNTQVYAPSANDQIYSVPCPAGQTITGSKTFTTSNVPYVLYEPSLTINTASTYKLTVTQ